MPSHAFYEIIGYVASLLVAVSLTMTSLVRLRVINAVGALAFTAYGVLVGAWPVAAVNAFILVINGVHLRRMSRSSEYFRLLEVNPDSDYLREFLRFNEAEIRRYLPHAQLAPRPGQLTLFVLRDLVPAGLLVGEVEGSTLRVDLDFVIAGYRDFKIGRFLFVEHMEHLRRKGITRIVSRAGTGVHARYLARMGFRPAAPDAGTYALPLAQ